MQHHCSRCNAKWKWLPKKSTRGGGAGKGGSSSGGVVQHCRATLLQQTAAQKTTAIRGKSNNQPDVCMAWLLNLVVMHCKLSGNLHGSMVHAQ